MKVSEYAEFDGVGLADLIARKEVKPSEVAAAAITACQTVNPAINAVIETWPEDVATQLASLPADGGTLSGVPFLIKDVAVTMRGHAVELGSRLAKGVRQPVDSWLMQRFREAGLVTLGRTSIPEMAYSTTTEPVAYGPCRNPWNPELSTAGSSGGSAASVAAGITPLAHATDGLGSIRIPAAWNGLVGLKISRGRVSDGPQVAEGLSALGIQFALSRSVRDSAALLDAIHGGAIGEPYEIVPPARPYLEEVARSPGPLRIAVITDGWAPVALATPIARAIEDVVQLCTNLGHRVESARLDLGVSWDAFTAANAAMWNPNLVNWSQACAAASGRAIDETTLEPATLACYRHGLDVSASDYLKAQDLRNIVTRRIGAFFVHFDLVLTPTTARMPIPIGTYLDNAPTHDALEWFAKLFAEAPFTPVFNVSGTPAISLPLAVESGTDLPIGIQFAAAFGREDLLFRVAGELESARPWSTRKPQIWAGRTLTPSGSNH